MASKIYPICCACGLNMKVHKQGVTVVEMAFNPPAPYCMISADEYACRNCDIKVIGHLAFASQPFSRHNDDDFKSKLWELVQDHPELVRVNWEHLPQAQMREDPIGYLLEWLRKESVNA